MVTVTSTDLETDAYVDDSFQFTIKNNGVAVDITGWTVYFTVKRNKKDTTALISKTITTHTTPASGITTVVIDKEDTQNLIDDYFYDLKVNNLSDDRKIYSVGKFTVNPGVKRT